MKKILDLRNSQINVTNGVLRELIFSRGWQVEPNAIGTVWHAINKMTYEFVTDLQKNMSKRIEKLNKDNESRQWKKNFIQVSQRVPWTDDVVIMLGTCIYVDRNSDLPPHICGIGVKIKGTNKRNSVNIQTAIDNYLNRELEKTLK